jgi:predicted dehydrogenase
VPVVDYTRSGLLLRVRKVARYLRLYGPSRTLVKVEAQYHMRGRRLPRPRPAPDPRAHVGIIGCGNFAFSTIAHVLERRAGREIRGTMDIAPQRAESLAARYGAHYATADAERVIADPAIDLVYIASNHASHADYAVRALDAGKSVHIEKPHAVSEAQLVALREAMARSRGRVRLGFNRPVSPLARELSELVTGQPGPINASWFVVGYRLPPGHWYLDPSEGGRVLGNLCHWTDFAYHLIPPQSRYPIEIRPVRNDEDVVVALRFGDGSTVTIAFAASGDAFEGVREHLGLQRGDLLAELADFKELRTSVGARRRRRVLRRRDHGHDEAVMRSYRMSDRAGAAPLGESAAYVWQTGELALRTKEALDTDARVVIAPPPA